LTPKSELESQLTGAYSPADDPADGVTVHASAANTLEIGASAMSATALSVRDRIKYIWKRIKRPEHNMLSLFFVKKKLVEREKLDTLFVHLYFNNISSLC
jgi:hypothetical protein